MVRGLVLIAGLFIQAGADAFAQTAGGAAAAAGTATTSQEREPPRRTRVQIGVSLKSTITPGIDTTDSIKPTFVWRWRGKGSRQDDRLAFAYRFSSYTSRISSQFGGAEYAVGDAKLRPLMVGADYKMPRGRWSWSVGLTAGLAINRVETPASYRDRITAAGHHDLYVDMDNSLIWSPRVKGWYDVNRRLSFMVESAYLVARPELTVRSNGIESVRRLNADAFIMKAGVVYGIW